MMTTADLTSSVVIRRSARARRISLKVDLRDGTVTLVLPPRATVAAGERFLAEQRQWVAQRLAALPAAQPLMDGATMPYRGVPHVIRHRPGSRGTVWIEQGEIHVAGAIEHLPRRLTDWLKRQARATLEPRVLELSASIGKRVRRVTVREMKTRWGSCSSEGQLSFSWRLILAPDTVADYLVAHEVAHLLHMDHSPRFWAAVDRLTPHRRSGEAWLKRHGATLHRIG